MKKEPFANQSFSDLVSKKNQDALRPFIMEELKKIEASLSRQLMEAIQMTLITPMTRIAVLEEILKEKLNESSESLAIRKAQIEDMLAGLLEVEDEIKENDTVRCEIDIEINDSKTSAVQTIKNINRSAVSPLDKNMQSALIGKKKGESVEIEENLGTNGESKIAKLKLRVLRISRPPEMPKKEESNVSQTNPQ